MELLDIVEHLDLEAVLPQREEVLEILDLQNIAEFQRPVVPLDSVKVDIVVLLATGLSTGELLYLEAPLDTVKASSLVRLVEVLDMPELQDIAEHWG